MATPSYVTLISGIVTRLQNDTRMSSIPNDSIYYGPEQQIPMFPAITVELTESTEEWKTFPQGKDEVTTVLLTVYDQYMLYQEGLQAVEGYVKNVCDTLQSDIGISGLAYNSSIGSKRFSPGTYNNIPTFACEVELIIKARFAPAT